MNEVNTPIDDAIHQAQAQTIGDVPMGSSTQTYINEFSSSVDNMTSAMKNARSAEAAYQNAGGHGAFDVTQYMDSTNNSMNFADSFKQFFTEALKQNEAIAQLQVTPITMASTMGSFTINIPSAIAPTFAALAANFANAYRESEEKAREVMKAQKAKQKEEKQQEQEQEQNVAGKQYEDIEEDIDDR